MSEFENKQRIIQEFVPGKQVTLAHVIAHPVEELYGKLGLFETGGAIGIFTIMPSEGAMIAADVASKAANVTIGYVDRFNGSLLITGDVSAVEAAMRDVMSVLCDLMNFTPARITRT
ncbi:BMC domain-containing protein [Cloacibacillus sp.]|uniref:BMC domain-containing protein n=1 Tax=Cloacibacillus sp. TaxID=2049023 RepID=UPI0025C5B11E|nr:BMC domain-containing protein [Cloacibacillus sp.]MCC8056683.1 BMC domain-containing protein [Cloacibacillus sp.]